MYELQTLSDFVNNPLGKGTSVLPNRDVIVNDFKRRKKIMEGEGKKFPVAVFKNDVKGTYYFHVLVPSETNRKNTYDVVFEFIPPEKKGAFGTVNLDKYTVRFFSNSPSFVFTYAHIMYNNGMGIKQLIKKFSSKVIRSAPEVRNPSGTILYEKSIMFAALTILEKSEYFAIPYLKTIQKNNAENSLFVKIRTDEQILEEIQDEKKRLSNEKRDNDTKMKDRQRERSNEVKKLAGSKLNRRIEASSSTSSTKKGANRIQKTSGKKTTRRK